MQLPSSLRAYLAEPAVPDPPRRVWRDWALVAVASLTAVLETVFRNDADWLAMSPAWRWGGLAVFFVAVPPALLVRRTRPLWALLIVFVPINVYGVVVSQAEGVYGGVNAMAFALITVYTVYRWGSGRDGVIGMATIITAWIVGTTSDPSATVGDWIGGSIVLSLPVTIGLAVRYRGTAHDRAIEAAKANEREQLARALHDTVAHHVSAIAVQAQAGRALASTDPERALAVLAVIEDAASRTLSEMRSMVGTLRRGAAELTPQKGVADLAALARDAAAGLAIHVCVDEELGAVGPAVDTALYRIAQESITNAFRHARGATTVTIMVDAEGDGVRITVQDDGEVPAGRRGEGYGLLGMAERAELLGGRLFAGPGGRRGWRVEAEFPEARLMLRVLIADDQELVRTGLGMILEAQHGIEVVAQVPDGRAAVEQARRLRPDVCLLDIRMPELNGIEVTRALAGPGVTDPLAVVVITTFDLDEYVYGALKAGARGFLLKDAGPELLVQAIHAAAQGDALIAPSVTARLLATFADAAPNDVRRPSEPLTAREEEVLVTVARGRTNAEIAAELYISLSTVKTHLGSLMAKLGARNRVEIAMWAYESGRMS